MIINAWPDVVKEEELWLRTEEGHVGQAGACQMIQCPLSQGAGAALVGLAGAWFLNRADHAQGFVPVEGVHPGRVGVRHHGHVGGLDAFPTTDGGAVKSKSLSEGFFLQQIGADGEVLPLAVQVSEFEVDQFDAFVLDLAQDVLGGFRHKKGLLD